MLSAHRHVRVERVVLEHHRDVPVLRRHVGDVPVTDEDLALVDLLQPGEHPQGGGLAASGRADEDHELAVADLQVDAGYRGLVGPGIPALRLLERHCGHGELLPSPAGTCRTIRSEVTAVTLVSAQATATPSHPRSSSPQPSARHPTGTGRSPRRRSRRRRRGSGTPAAASGRARSATSFPTYDVSSVSRTAAVTSTGSPGSVDGDRPDPASSAPGRARHLRREAVEQCRPIGPRPRPPGSPPASRTGRSARDSGGRTFHASRSLRGGVADDARAGPAGAGGDVQVPGAGRRPAHDPRVAPVRRSPSTRRRTTAGRPPAPGRRGSQVMRSVRAGGADPLHAPAVGGGTAGGEQPPSARPSRTVQPVHCARSSKPARRCGQRVRQPSPPSQVGRRSRARRGRGRAAGPGRRGRGARAGRTGGGAAPSSASQKSQTQSSAGRTSAGRRARGAPGRSRARSPPRRTPTRPSTPPRQHRVESAVAPGRARAGRGWGSRR